MSAERRAPSAESGHSAFRTPHSALGEQLALDWTLDPAERRVLAILDGHRGRANALPVADLALAAWPADWAVTNQRHLERRAQAIVHRLRVQHGQPIGSAAGKPNGYYILETADELEAFRREQRRKALGTLLAVARACKATLPDLLGQIRMEYEAREGKAA